MSKRGFALVFTVLCTASAAHADDWVQLGDDCEQTRDSAELSSPAFAPAWRKDLKSGPIIATPVTAGGQIVVAASNGAVAALSPADGGALWTRTLTEGVRATPAISRDRVVVSTMGGTLYALGLADGQIAWQRSFGGQNYSSPQLVAGSPAEPRETVVVGAGFPSQDVWRFDVATGAPLWQTPKGAIPALVYSTAAVAGSRIVIGMNGGRFQSFDLATGAPSWKLDASGPVYLSSPLVVGGSVYAFPGDPGVNVYGADAATGAPLAGFPVAIPDLAPVAGTTPFDQGPAVSSPMAVGGVIIVQVRRQDMMPAGRTYTVFMRESVVAIDPATAQVRWQYALGNVVAQTPNDVPELGLCATPVGFDGPNGPFVAAVSSIVGRVVVLDVATGQERWSAALGAPGRASPIFSNGQLLVATDDGALNAFASASNRAPAPPTMLEPTGQTDFVAAGNTLRWSGATDPDGGPLSYVVEVQEDGAPETLVERAAAPGQAQLTIALDPEKSYLFAVRTRDAQGALSAWSAPQVFQLGPRTAVSAGDTPSQPSGSPPPNGASPPPSGGPSASGGDAPLPGAGPGAGAGSAPPPGAPATVSVAAGAPGEGLNDGGADGAAADAAVTDALASSQGEAHGDAGPCQLTHASVASPGQVSEDDAGCSVAGRRSFSTSALALLALIWAARRRTRRGQRVSQQVSGA